MFSKRASREQVKFLREYTGVLCESVIQRRERVRLVERLIPLFHSPEFIKSVASLLGEAQLVFPAHTVNCTLLGNDRQFQISIDETGKGAVGTDATVKDSWCRYTVATGKPFLVTDGIGRENLVVCTSPYTATGEVRSYIGAPLIVNTWPVGSFCAHNTEAQGEWTDADTDVFRIRAAQVSLLLEAMLLRGSE